MFSRSLSLLLSFWSSVSRAIVIFSCFSPSLSDDDKDHDDLTKDWRLLTLLSLSAELSSSFLAPSPFFSPSGRLSAELSSSFLISLLLFPTTTRTTTTSLRIGVFLVCLPSYCLLFSFSPPFFPPSGRLSAELSSSSLACSPFLLRRRR